jgi:type II secretion system protein N
MKVPRIELGRLGDLSRLRALPLHLSGRQRTIARWAGISLLALVSFLFALKFTFPYDRLEGKLAEALAGKYDVTVGDVGGGFLPGTVVFEDVVLRSRPDTPGEKATEIAIDELVLDLGLDFGLVGALRKKAVFDVDAELVGGTIEAEVESSASDFEAHIETEALELGKLPGVAAAVGLPLSGALDAEIDLHLPGAKWKNAEGRIALDCIGCTVGDGVAKLTMTPNGGSSRRRRSAGAAAFQSTGVTVPRLALGQAQVQLDITKGVGEIKNFSATSQDGWLKIEGKIEFRDPFANTLFPGCMRFKLSDELKKRDPKFGNIEYTLSEKVRQQDGSFAIPTKGRLTELRWDVRRKCGGGAADTETEDRRLSDRPGLARRPRLGQPGAEGDEVPGATEGLRREVGARPEQEDGRGREGRQEVPEPGSSGPPMNGRGSSGDAGAAPPPPPTDDQGGSGDAVLQRMPPEQEQQPPPQEGAEPPPPPPPGEGDEVQPPPEGAEPPQDQQLPEQPPPEQPPDQPPDQQPPQEQPQEGQFEPPPRDPEDRTVQ